MKGQGVVCEPKGKAVSGGSEDNGRGKLFLERAVEALTGSMRPAKENKIILTGPPRAGKTLSAFLLNQLSNVIALSEPLKQKQLKDPALSLEEIKKFFRKTERSLFKEGTAIANPFEPDLFHRTKDVSQQTRLQALEGRKQWVIKFHKALSPGFQLVIEHSAPFTALLSQLIGRYPCYAIIRNPLALLAAWNQEGSGTLRLGHFPTAQRLDPRLARALSEVPDTIGRQIQILSWFFERYLSLPRERVISYESLVASGGRALGVINEAALGLHEPLDLRHGNELWTCGFREELGERLLRSEGAFWKFYTRESVETLLAETSLAGSK